MTSIIMQSSSETSIDDTIKWSSMKRFLSRQSPFGNETGQLPNGYYEPGIELFHRLHNDTKVLVVGAGGLGCEILKVYIDIQY